MASPSKGKDERDNPTIHFTGELKDWQPFKQAVRKLADRYDYTWVFDTGAALYDFYVSQNRDKAGSARSRKAALECEINPKPDGNHVPTDVFAYHQEPFDRWFDENVADDPNMAKTDVMLSLNKNRVSAMGSNFSDHKKLGYDTQEQLARAHKQTDMKYLKKVNRLAVTILHDSVFEHPRKDTAGRRKLLSILQNNEVKSILAGTPLDDKELQWIKRPWEIPAVQIWARIMLKYEGMQEALSGTFMEELADTITCVTGPANKRRTIHEADQEFERYGKALVSNFKTVDKLWDFMRASLRASHIRKLSKVGKDKAAWGKADEYLTELMDSDTMLTLENTDDAMKRADKFMQRSDKEESHADQSDKQVAFGASIEELQDDAPQMVALRAELKAKDARLAALEAKFDRLSPPPDARDKKRRRDNKSGPGPPPCAYCKKPGHAEATCWIKQKDELETKITKADAARESRKPSAAEKKAYRAGVLVNKGPAAAAAAGDNYATCPCPTASPTSPPPAPPAKDVAISVAHTVSLNQKFIPRGDLATVDSASMLNVCGIRGPLGKGARFSLLGVTGDTVDAEKTNVTFPVKMGNNKTYNIQLPDQSLVVDRQTTPDVPTLLSLAVLLKSGFEVTFAVGSKRDPTYGGQLVAPDGQVARMIFEDNMWKLPLSSAPVRHESRTYTTVCAEQALAQPDLPDSVQIQLHHDIWCHPCNGKLEHIHRMRKGRGFPTGFLKRLRQFNCVTCSVSKRTRRYRRSKRVKLKLSARRQSKKQASLAPYTGIFQCSGCSRVFDNPQGLQHHRDESTKCPQSVKFQPTTTFQHPEQVLDSAEAADALHQVHALSGSVSEGATTSLTRLHIDFAHSISVGVHKEKYFLIMVLDGIDFTFCSASARRTEPEDLIHEFLTLTRATIDSIRFDGAAEFAKSATFKAYCQNHKIAQEPVPAYTHTFNARAEGAVRIVKEHMRCLLRRANLPRRFWPYAMLHFCRIYAYWPDSTGKSAWEKLDAVGPHALCHDESRDLHRFGSYVTGHLPRTHPLVDNETMDDRALEGVWLGNDLTTPTFWMYSFQLRKIVRLSDPRHFDHILPFLQPDDLPHKIALSPADICDMHAEDGDDIEMPTRKSTRFRQDASGKAELIDSDASEATLQLQHHAPRLTGAPPRDRTSTLGSSADNSGEIEQQEQDSGEQEQEPGEQLTLQQLLLQEKDTGEPLIESSTNEPQKLGRKEYKRLKHGNEVPFDAELQYLKPQLLAQALVHHRFTMDLPEGIWIDEKTDKSSRCRVMATKAYSRTTAKFWYVDFTILSHQDRAVLQLPLRRGKTKSVDHRMNLEDLFRQLFNYPKTLKDIGITAERSARVMVATADAWKGVLENVFSLTYLVDSHRKVREQKEDATRAAVTEQTAILDAKARGPPSGHLKQVIPTCEPVSDTIFDEIDLLEGDPPHRGAAMRNNRFRPYWMQAEEQEWKGLWDKGVFKKWDRKDLMGNDRVFTSRYVYKLKRSASTGEVYRFKARLIVRGFQMEKGIDFQDSFSPTPGLAIGRFMLSLAVANDFELHACDIEQAFLQADKLPEGVNGRYFIQPPPGSPDAENKDVVYEVCKPLYGNPSSPRALHKTLDAHFRSEGFQHVGFEESVWMRPKGGKYQEDLYVSAHVDDCLICCKSPTVMAAFKRNLFKRFEGTDEGEVKQYLGCEVIRDRAARTGKLVQSGYAERVLRTFGMWDCNPTLTPLDPNTRLTKKDSPEAVDPRLHKRMRSITGCLSYLVNMTRPDLAFTYSQLSKFVQSPGPVHLAAAERALAYLRGTYDEGITFFDPGEGRRNKLTGWVDSDFAADPDTRKSMTGYVFSLNGGAVSWRSSRQGGVTLSSAEAEFVAASQAGQEAVYLRALLRGFNFKQKGPTEIWEDNASCIMMSENPANRERTRHVDTRVHYLRDLVRDGHVKLLKCAGPQNVADALTKSLPCPALAKHRQYMWGTRVPFSAFFLSMRTGKFPTASYSILSSRSRVAAPAA